ncbi:MAG: alpha/beta hydrolase [Betaproteobacteria bacterium]|nr:MAG: alpha/beta hydrolase [Betaproteobacteria bacterium]
MYAPGGFDATIEKWSTQGVYARVKLLDHLPKKYRCIVFDRRECGQSAGRLELITWAHYARHGKALLEHLPKKYRCIVFDRRECGQSAGRLELITWAHYARHGKALLEHLGMERAHVMGGCMGVSCVMAFAVAHPAATLSMLLWWPVGGAKYRIKAHQRFADHLAFVKDSGLDGVVAHVRKEGKAFNADPRGGPWASPIRNDRAFADTFAKQDAGKYSQLVERMAKTLFDRDTSPGAEPEQLFKLDIPALIVPGKDESHATSAARYLEECLPKSQYWDALPEAQTEANAPKRLLDFLSQ